MTDTPDNESWALTMLDMAYTPKLDPETQQQYVRQIVGYFDDAVAKGISLEFARETLRNTFLDIMPVIEPLHRVLKRTLRDLAAS